MSKHESQKQLIVASGTRLLDIAPIVFPGHVLIQQLMAERDAMKAAMLTRYWRDNGPWALFRSMRLCNSGPNNGACQACKDRPITCRFWDRLTFYMRNCGITYDIINVRDTERDGWPVAASGPSCIAGVPPCARSLSVDEDVLPMPGFDPVTACKYMACVSHRDVHIIFTRDQAILGITYGRRLWQEEDVAGSPELRKLDMLFGRLHTH